MPQTLVGLARITREEGDPAQRRKEPRPWHVAVVVLKAGQAAWLHGEPAATEAYAGETVERYRAEGGNSQGV